MTLGFRKPPETHRSQHTPYVPLQVIVRTLYADKRKKSIFTG